MCVVGMVFVIEALPYITFPGKVKEFAKHIDTVPDKTLKLIGIVAAFAGIGIIYLGRFLGRIG